MPTGPINASQQAQEGVNRAVAEAEDTFTRIRTFRQKNEASAYVFERLNDIKSRADQDIDLDSSKYEAEIEKVGQDASKNIGGQIAREEFAADFQKQATAVKWGIKNDFRVKELKAADATIDYQGQQIIDSYGGMDEATKAISVVNYRKALENGVVLGLYNEGTAKVKYAEFQKKVIKGSVDYGILTNPEEALAELQKGDEGIYPGLDQTDRVNFIKESETRIEKLANQEKETIAIATNKRESELIDLKIAQTLTVPEVKKERGQGTISAQFADTMIRSLERPKQAKSNSASFNKIVDFILNPENKPEDIRQELLKENAKGTLPEDEFSVLYAFNQQVNNDTLDKTLPKKNLIQALTFWTDEYAQARPEVKTRMFKLYMQKISAGQNPSSAVDEIIRQEVLNSHPQAANYPKEGKRVVDVMGTIKRIFPTGEIGDEE